MIDKQEFVKSYLDLIGYLGEKHNSVYWWASFTASKNKFVSTLRQNLYELVTTGIYPKQQRRNAVLSAIRFILGTWIKIVVARYYFYRQGKQISRGDERYILRTWLYESSIDTSGKYHDPFFGELQEYLVKNKKNPLVLAGFIGRYAKIAKKASKSDAPIIAQEYFLSFKDPVVAVVRAWRNIPKISGRIDFCKHDITQIVREEIENDFLNNVPGQYLYYILTRRIAKQINIETYTLSFENNPYERMQMLALREYLTTTKIYGYQHVPIADSALNLFLGKKEGAIAPAPDKIITIGTPTKELLEEQGYQPEIVAGCGLRFELKNPLMLNQHLLIHKIILVTPEGGLDESVNLVNFVGNTLEKYFPENYPSLVIVRSHPELPFEKYKHLLTFDLTKISISHTASLESDLIFADVLIYRGSSSVISAIKYGLATIYVEFEKDIASLDPVKENTALKHVVKTEAELFEALNKISFMVEGDFIKESLKAKEFISRYINEVTDKTMAVFL